MAAELPAALKAAIARELEGASRRDLAGRSAATTATYRSGGTSAAAIRGAGDALAYATTRLPATYAACAEAMAAARAAAPGFAPASLLDAGCGPGGGSWAACETWPALSRIGWLDASPTFLDLAARLAAEGPEAVRDADARRGDLGSADLPAADLVLASYALAEIAEAGQGAVVDRLWVASRSMLILVEPGTPAGFARLLAARDRLVAAGAQILAPCPHEDACPLAARDDRPEGFPGWCHFSVRLPRSRDHLAAKRAAVPFEDEKFAYLVAGRPEIADPHRRARVLARPKVGKPGIDLKLCGPDGLEARFVPRRDKAAHARTRRLDWGDQA